MARRRATVRYNTGTAKNPKVQAEQIWINQLDGQQAKGDDIILKLYLDEDGKAVLTPDREGNLQYQCSIPVEGGAFAYISVNAMKALVATSRVRDIDGDNWVHLSFDNLTPTVSEFARATAIKEVK